MKRYRDRDLASLMKTVRNSVRSSSRSHAISRLWIWLRLLFSRIKSLILIRHERHSNRINTYANKKYKFKRKRRELTIQKFRSWSRSIQSPRRRTDPLSEMCARKRRIFCNRRKNLILLGTRKASCRSQISNWWLKTINLTRACWQLPWFKGWTTAPLKQ